MYKRPSLFKNSKSIKKKMDNVKDALVQNTLKTGYDVAKQFEDEDTKVVKKPKYLQVTEERMENLGVIDLKPYFARSSKAKQKEDGGWYLTVPIRRKKKDMSRRMYEQLRNVQVPSGGQKTVISDYLYDRRRESGATMLNYQPKSKNITKQNKGENRSNYVSFRTVSDKSDAGSWIINRDRINEDDTSKTMVKNVDRLMKWKMKNGWK